MCGMSWVQNPRRRTGKMRLLYIGSVFGRWCTNPRRPGDPVAGTWGSGAQGGNRKKGNGTSSRTPDARENGACVCMCALCVPKGKDPRAVSSVMAVTSHYACFSYFHISTCRTVPTGPQTGVASRVLAKRGIQKRLKEGGSTMGRLRGFRPVCDGPAGLTAVIAVRLAASTFCNAFLGRT